MIVGVDPGNKGAIAVFDEKTAELVQLLDMPTIAVQLKTKTKNNVDASAVSDLLKFVNPSQVIIEQVSARPGEGAANSFYFGYGYGLFIGVCRCLDIPVRQVTPNEWKKHFDLIKKPKSDSCLIARKRFPAFQFQSKFKNRKGGHNALDGRGDAALIALYAHETSIS